MKKIGSIVLILLIIIFSYIAFNYINYRTKNAVSDAAFIKTDSLLTLSFKVGGKIRNIFKNEGDKIKKGELLALLDDKDFNLSLQKVQKDIDSLKAKKDALKLQRERSKKELEINIALAKDNQKYLQKKIESFKDKISSNEAKLNKLKRDEKRYKNLLQKNLISKESYENIKTTLNSLKDMIDAQKKELKSLYIKLDSSKKEIKLSQIKKDLLLELDKNIDSLKEKIEALKKTKQELLNKISYCRLYSPIDGVVAKKFVNEKSVVKKGYPILSVVNPKDLHIEVLLSEKKIEGVKPKNSVKIKVDAFPNRTYKGEVEKILPASAATFSLVPRDIASGEFTKLDQRFIVRIKILNPTKDLRVGMGATVAISKSR